MDPRPAFEKPKTGNGPLTEGAETADNNPVTSWLDKETDISWRMANYYGREVADLPEISQERIFAELTERKKQVVPNSSKEKISFSQIIEGLLQSLIEEEKIKIVPGPSETIH